MPEPIEWEITEDQLANYPSYSWPLKCCWCGSGLGAQVRARNVDGIMFICDVCGKPNSVTRRGTKIAVSPAKSGSLLSMAKIIALLALLVTACVIFGRGTLLPTTGNYANKIFDEHRNLFWFTTGAVIMSIMQIHAIGWKKYRTGNHPLQALIAMIVIGGLFGLAMGWLTKLVFQ